MEYIKLEHVLQFLEDEALSGSAKVINADKQKYEIRINDPFCDDHGKKKLSIGVIERDGQLITVFNAYKAVAVLGEEYKGHFWKFVRLVKELHSNSEAKYYFLKKYTLKDGIQAIGTWYSESQGTIETVEDTEKLTFPQRFIKFKNQQQYMDYLVGRGVSADMITKLKMYIDPEQKRIVFPVYEDDSLIFYTGRCIVKNPIPWLKAKAQGAYPIWNLENIHGDVVNIFEGIFDALMLPSSVAILGATNTSDNIVNKIIDKNFAKVNIYMDNDAAGISAKYVLADKLSKRHKNVWIYDFKGISKKDCKDFNSMRTNGVDFDLNNRLKKWGLETALLIKMGAVI